MDNAIFAAAGHFNYLKSAYLYLQTMINLETTHPLLFRKFEQGFHVIVTVISSGQALDQT
jgi:hypothetical protein